VDAPEDLDKAAQKFKDVYKTYLANLPLDQKNSVNKKKNNPKIVKTNKSLKGSKQKILISKKSNKKQ
jgi:hypothetical protein